MMNQYTSYCQVGDTFRNTCPIQTDALHPCVYLEYSFWKCFNARPPNGEEANDEFVKGFCSAQTLDRTIQLCNGDGLVLEYVETGWGSEESLQVSKNQYGLELRIYYVWWNAGVGEHRRRIETDFVEDDAWLTNAQASSSVGDQTIAMKYRVLPKTKSLARLTQPVKVAVVLSLVTLVGSFII